MVQVIAHRGVRNFFPENTLKGISTALEQGFDGVEFDVELTRDSRLVVLHQETMVADRGAVALLPGDRKQSHAWVHELDAEQVTRLDAGSWFDPAFENQKVPLLEEVLILNRNSTRFYLEVKDPFFWKDRNLAYERSVCRALSDLKDSLAIDDFLLSFNPYILLGLRDEGCIQPQVLLIWRNLIGKEAQVEQLIKQLRPSALCLVEDMILGSQTWVALARNYGCRLLSYPFSPTYGEPDHENWQASSREATWLGLIQAGVDGIVSDFPKELVEFLKRAPL